jgi:hypothetical protein
MAMTEPLQPIWQGTHPVQSGPNNATEIAELKLYDYSERSVALTTGESFGRAYSHALKGIGAYNKNLKVGQGWVFAKTKYPDLQKLIADITSGLVRPQVFVTSPSRTPSVRSTSPQIAAPGSMRLVVRPAGSLVSPPPVNFNQQQPLYPSPSYDIRGQSIPLPPGVTQAAIPELSTMDLLDRLLARMRTTEGVVEGLDPNTGRQRVTIWGSTIYVSGNLTSRMNPIMTVEASDRKAVIAEIYEPSISRSPPRIMVTSSSPNQPSTSPSRSPRSPRSPLPTVSTSALSQLQPLDSNSLFQTPSLQSLSLDEGGLTPSVTRLSSPSPAGFLSTVGLASITESSSDN